MRPIEIKEKVEEMKKNEEVNKKKKILTEKNEREKIVVDNSVTNCNENVERKNNKTKIHQTIASKVEFKENSGESTSESQIDFQRKYTPTDFNILEADDWVLVDYFGTYHIGQVNKVSSEYNCAKVRCLIEPYSLFFVQAKHTGA